MKLVKIAARHNPVLRATHLVPSDRSTCDDSGGRDGWVHEYGMKLKLMEAWVICDTLSVCVRGVTNRKGVDLFELGIRYIVILERRKYKDWIVYIITCEPSVNKTMP